MTQNTISITSVDQQSENKSGQNPLDIDLEEVTDRLEEIQDTCHQMIANSQNKEMYKIIITAYSIERVKILSLIYKIRQCKAIK